MIIPSWEDEAGDWEDEAGEWEDETLNESPSAFVCGQIGRQCFWKHLSSRRAPATLVDEGGGGFDRLASAAG
jgi:hypothetical protein